MLIVIFYLPEARILHLHMVRIIVKRGDCRGNASSYLNNKKLKYVIKIGTNFFGNSFADAK